MADQQDPHSLASTFPNPPSFWRDFTAEKIARIETLRQAYATEKQLDKANAVGATTTEGDGAAALTPALLLPARIPGVPDDLALLQPPPEPADGRWRVFGDQYMLDDKLPTLEEQGILNLPPTHPSRRAATTSLTTAANTAASLDARDGTHYDHALELKRLVKSLLVNFLELTGTLARNPAHAAAKVDDLRTLLINIHHALNEYRPHQARESAAEMMQEHLDRTRRETIAVRSQVDRARRVLEGLGSLTIAQEALLGNDAKGGGRVAAAAAVDQALERDKARETEVWAEVDALFA